jgi:nucleotide-binding universal stress UspA family protein
MAAEGPTFIFTDLCDSSVNRLPALEKCSAPHLLHCDGVLPIRHRTAGFWRRAPANGDAGADQFLQLFPQQRKRTTMTILVAYVPRPEGQAALDKGIEIAKRRNEPLVVVNASPGGRQEDLSKADVQDVERVEELLAGSGLDATFKQFVRGNSAVSEIEALVESLPVSILVIGLRKRTPVGKFIMGSVAQEILLSVSCPVLAVKAG